MYIIVKSQPRKKNGTYQSYFRYKKLFLTAVIFFDGNLKRKRGSLFEVLRRKPLFKSFSVHTTQKTEACFLFSFLFIEFLKLYKQEVLSVLMLT